MIKHKPPVRDVPAKYSVGQQLRAVKGPGGYLQPEWWALGRVGTVTGLQTFKTTQPCYTLDFGDDQHDTIDECCLEVHRANPC